MNIRIKLLPYERFKRDKYKAIIKDLKEDTIILIDGSKLVDLMHKFNVGIQVKSYYEVKVLDNDFFDAEEI